MGEVGSAGKPKIGGRREETTGRMKPRDEGESIEHSISDEPGLVLRLGPLTNATVGSQAHGKKTSGWIMPRAIGRNSAVRVEIPSTNRSRGIIP